MGSLDTLIRISKHELDEKRRALKELYDTLNAYEDAKQALKDGIAREQKALDGQEWNAHLTYAAFHRKSEKEIAELSKKIATVEKEIFVLRDEMLEVFGEMKRYDIANELRRRIEDEARRLAETKTLDEIALEIFRRAE
ncbi:MAG: hypothetical protein EA357_11780 [Micavibrio sp.]|nr:MAG: hypothetical protein EA357_11780 [Micavibrio sp.]